MGLPMAFNAKIIEAGLNTAVRASTHSDLKLMRQLDILPAQKILFVDLLCQSLGIIVAIHTGGSLAGSNRADLGAGAAAQ